MNKKIIQLTEKQGVMICGFIETFTEFVPIAAQLFDDSQLRKFEELKKEIEAQMGTSWREACIKIIPDKTLNLSEIEENQKALDSLNERFGFK